MGASAQFGNTGKYDVLIAGGGAGGLTVASRLRKLKKDLSIAIVEPSDKHFYQPLWTLVGGGVMSREKTKRNQADLIPKGVIWIKDSISGFDPREKTVALKSGTSVSYEFLVVALGLQVDWNKIKGLIETIGKNGVCSNYSFDTVPYTWSAISEFQGGKALFTFPNTPVKCGGAPQKIMYLAEDYFRKNGLREKSEVSFFSAGANIFAVPKYAKALEGVIEKRGIKTHYKMNLVAVDGAKKEATFEVLGPNGPTGEKRVEKFDMIHVTPPMSAPDVVKSSALAGPAGWVEVDKHTLQHTRFTNVFALGDVSNLPTSKTGAAIRKQAPVLIENLLAVREGKSPSAKYNGYTSCPLVTGYGKLILAEFDYDGKPQETFPFDQGKERRSMYLLKKHLLPPLYWEGMLKGRA